MTDTGTEKAIVNIKNQPIGLKPSKAKAPAKPKVKAPIANTHFNNDFITNDFTGNCNGT